MGIILSALILIGLLGAFFKAKLGVVGLLILSVFVWNFIGRFTDYFNNSGY